MSSQCTSTCAPYATTALRPQGDHGTPVAHVHGVEHGPDLHEMCIQTSYDAYSKRIDLSSLAVEFWTQKDI